MKLDRKAIETTITSGLPVHACWMIGGTSLEFDFSLARQGLRALPDEAMEAGEAVAFDLLVFGQQDFAEGGGALRVLNVRPGVMTRTHTGSPTRIKYVVLPQTRCKDSRLPIKSKVEPPSRAARQ